MPEAPASDLTAVVEVEQVVLAPPAFADTEGEITVLVPAERPVSVGDRRTFHCVGWVYGSGLAVEALDVTAAEAAAATARGAAEPTGALAARELGRRVASSELIVGGRVTDVRSAAASAEQRQVSEHDADWHVAVVQVESVEKGEAPAGDVVVAFPLSRDVAWYRAPKFEVGQRGLWMLQPAERADLPVAEARAFAEQPQQVFTALDPLDFQPASEAPRVRSLTERPAE